MKPPGKQETLLSYLERGIAMLHLDARRPGVRVPPQHEGDAHLRINLSYRYGIPDLVIDDARVQATLSFGGRPFQCQLPWSAVFGITSQTSGDGQVWPEDLPTEVMSSLAAQEGKPGEKKAGVEKVPHKPKRSKPALVAVESDPGDAGEAAATPRAKGPIKLSAAPDAGSAKREPQRHGEETGAAHQPGEAGSDGKPPPTDPPPRKSHLRLIRD